MLTSLPPLATTGSRTGYPQATGTGYPPTTATSYPSATTNSPRKSSVQPVTVTVATLANPRPSLVLSDSQTRSPMQAGTLARGSVQAGTLSYSFLQSGIMARSSAEGVTQAQCSIQVGKLANSSTHAGTLAHSAMHAGTLALSSAPPSTLTHNSELTGSLSECSPIVQHYEEGIYANTSNPYTTVELPTWYTAADRPSWYIATTDAPSWYTSTASSSQCNDLSVMSDSVVIGNSWLSATDFSVMEFPRENLKYLRMLGEGQFGEVYLCEALHMTDFLGSEFLINRTGASRSMLVAIKVLRTNANDEARYSNNDVYKPFSLQASQMVNYPKF